MRDVKTRAAMEQPKTRQKNAMPRTAVRILQRHYAQQKQERQMQRQRQPVEYATEQVRQGTAEVTRLTFRARSSFSGSTSCTNTVRRRYGSGRRQRRHRCASGICGSQRSRPPQRSTLPQCRANRHKNRLHQP